MRRLAAAAVVVLLGMLAMAANAMGRDWIVQSAPSVQGARYTFLYGVSCTSESSCVAVGNYRTADWSRTLPVAEAWDGTSWTLMTVPAPAGVTDANLNDVSCVSAAACMAVGGTNQGPLAEWWNGQSWAIISPATLNSSLSSGFGAVSCTSSSACTALGGSKGQTVERWNGTSWTTLTTPAPDAGTILYDISCSSASACTVVGAWNFGPFAEAWNGLTWSLQTPPGHGLFSAVSCTSAAACTAVGSSQTSSRGPTAGVVERWDGNAWTVQNAPTPSGAWGSQLNDVSCVSGTNCTTVGLFHAYAGSPDFTLAGNWTGTDWSVDNTPNPSSVENDLVGVSCVGKNTCTAVGSLATTPLIERIS